MNKSKLEMIDLYFSKFSFSQHKTEGKIDLFTQFKINCFQNSKDNSLYRVEINTHINDKNYTFLLDLQTVGIFRLDKTNLDQETIKNIIKRNTIAIMFPYVRSQISLLTAQPGMMPIMLQPIDTSQIDETFIIE